MRTLDEILYDAETEFSHAASFWHTAKTDEDTERALRGLFNTVDHLLRYVCRRDGHDPTLRQDTPTGPELAADIDQARGQ